jgi:regulator of ribonuclease activity A
VRNELAGQRAFAHGQRNPPAHVARAPAAVQSPLPRALRNATGDLSSSVDEARHRRPCEKRGMTAADLSDAHGETLQVAPPLVRDFGGRLASTGPITTLKVHEDNAPVRKALEESGHRRVLVVDGGGSLRRALPGDTLAALGAKNGWAGVVVWGCVRDADALAILDIGVKALGTNPRKSGKTGAGARDVVVRFGEVE